MVLKARLKLKEAYVAAAACWHLLLLFIFACCACCLGVMLHAQMLAHLGCVANVIDAVHISQ